MEENDFVSLEVADILNDNGYDKPCRRFYCKMYNRVLDCTKDNLRFNQVTYKELEKGDVLIPYIWDALKWIREKYKRHINVVYWPNLLSNCGENCWEPLIVNMDKLSENKYTNKEYPTMEEALNEGIKELFKSY